MRFKNQIGSIPWRCCHPDLADVVIPDQVRDDKLFFVDQTSNEPILWGIERKIKTSFIFVEN